MGIKEVLQLCKDGLGRDVRYVKKLHNGNFEVHEIKHKKIIKYIVKVEKEKIRVIEETEEEIERK